MRMLFAHDHIFDTDASGNAYSEKLPYEVWRVYLERFSNIVIFGRAKSVPASAKPLVTGHGIEFVGLPSISSARGIVRNRARVREAIRNALHAVDAVVVRLPSEFGLVAFWEARRASKPVLVEMVGSARQSLWHHGSVIGKIYSVIAWWRTRRAVRAASHVSYVTKSFLQRAYPTRGRAVGISDVQLETIVEGVLDRRLARRPDATDVTRIGMIGQLLPYKGISTLLDACARLKQEGFALRIEIVGSGDPERWRREAEQKGLAGECEFLGTKPAGEAIFKWLDTVDLYIQPSLTEGLSRATLEALSRACPVVASRVGGLPEIVPSQYLAKPGDPEHLAHLMRTLITDPDARRSASIENFEVARAFTREALAQRGRHFLDEFIDTAKVGRAASVPATVTS
jgi:glycosyltransferase involved in cell wall biosynthesis